MSTVWQELHSNYQVQDWIEKPSLFAEVAAPYFPKSGKILELGSGHGQDTFSFAQRGYEVVSTDIEVSSLLQKLAKQSTSIRDKIEIAQIDLKSPLPYEDETFDVVYAHLSLHYFDEKTTQQIFNEIRRVLKPGGTFAFLVNSVNDPEYGAGKKIEDDFFLIDKVTKRYFSANTASRFAQGFNTILVDNLGETYKDKAKGITNLVRFVGTKRIAKTAH